MGRLPDRSLTGRCPVIHRGFEAPAHGTYPTRYRTWVSRYREGETP